MIGLWYLWPAFNSLRRRLSPPPLRQRPRCDASSSLPPWSCSRWAAQPWSSPPRRKTPSGGGPGRGATSICSPRRACCRCPSPAACRQRRVQYPDRPWSGMGQWGDCCRRWRTERGGRTPAHWPPGRCRGRAGAGCWFTNIVLQGVFAPWKDCLKTLAASASSGGRSPAATASWTVLTETPLAAARECLALAVQCLLRQCKRACASTVVRSSWRRPPYPYLWEGLD